ncbi:Type I restriction-modification system, specificity subunit S [Staphylococcus aureus]|uniref:restriction endonuclease subunit S n=1 Tax=Staphylococcus aureus TaxID=1280 RepID=UPI00091D123B|nr:restriction endonuclease subunit S [Staphylococcus aureus]WQK93612.1 restriction endonuclease subunit S [Staphylococcus aureus]SGU31182.1 Type I restriction-modification system, specificity subunit S [Staphylococcus aureus]SGU45508.1 Type I restriction-modification system, specificity subunit S [Staphylococcus aureus]SGZ16826.1 Type I restriction-modification system, specificity subunit S [Staphylococcus aureus]SGZ21632.1 Type I restriction-modification system, specificity subunit S [Staphy
MSNTQKKNVPELRFPGFEGEWEEKKLGDLTDRVIRKNQNLESKKPLTISGQLGLIDQTEYFSKSVSSKNLENYTLIKNGEFAYNKSYSNGYPLGAIKRLTRYDSGVLSSLYICFSIKSEISKDFMEAYFDSTHWYREVSGIAVEGARNHGLLNISVNDFFTIPIKYPSLEEQRKIGDFFIKLDRQIELEEQKLELLQQQKKGYMQKIFSQELRFKDENGEDYPEWEVTSIQDVTKYTSSKKSSNQYADKDNSKGYPVYDAVQEIGKDSNYDIEESYISILKDGAGVGRLNLRSGKSSVIGTMGYLQPYNIDIEFLYYRMKVLNFKKYIIGSTIPHLYFKDYSKETLYIPSSIKEQTKIGRFISNLDKVIENKTLKINYLKQFKQGLLQGMFI